MSRLFLFGILIFHASPDYSQTFLKERFVIHFEKDIDTISQFEKKTIQNYISKFDQTFIDSIWIAGHTDGDGSTNYNDNLSTRRSASVQRLLEEHNLNTDYVLTKSFGEKQLLLKEINEKEKSQNRRVEIVVKYLKANTIEDLLKSIQPDLTQVFSFDEKIENIEVNAKKGTHIQMNRSDLVYEDGSPLREHDKVNISLTEIQSFADQIQSGISTETHDGQILESGGMFNLTVSSNDKPLKLKDGAEYKADLPNKFKQNNMNVFRGQKDENGIIKWNVTEAEFVNKTKSKIPRPSVCLDSQKLSKWNLQGRLSEYLVKREFNIEMPIMSSKPVAPREPDYPNLRPESDYFTWLERIFIPKSKRVAFMNKIHGNQLDRYEKREDKYDENFIKYDTKSNAYKLQLAKYEIAMRNYEDSIWSMYTHLNNYRLASIELTYVKILKNRLKSMVKLSQRDSLFVYDLNSYLFSDFIQLAKFIPDNYYKKTRHELDEILKEYYNEKDAKIAYAKYESAQNEARNIRRKDVYLTVGDWKKSSSDPVISYLKSKNMELYERELLAGYKPEVDNMNFFYANLTDFSWINCDKFMNTPKNMIVNYRIIDTMQSNWNVKTMVILPKINSCLNVRNGFNIPKYQQGDLVSYYLDSDKKIMFAKAKIDKETSTDVPLEYKPISYKELVNSIKKL